MDHAYHFVDAAGAGVAALLEALHQCVSRNQCGTADNCSGAERTNRGHKRRRQPGRRRSCSGCNLSGSGGCCCGKGRTRGDRIRRNFCSGFCRLGRNCCAGFGGDAGHLQRLCHNPLSSNIGESPKDRTTHGAAETDKCRTQISGALYQTLELIRQRRRGIAQDARSRVARLLTVVGGCFQIAFPGRRNAVQPVGLCLIELVVIVLLHDQPGRQRFIEQLSFALIEAFADFPAVLLLLQVAHLLVEVLLDRQRFLQPRLVLVASTGTFQFKGKTIGLGLDIEFQG